MDDKGRSRQLFLDIQKRGPEAFYKLLSALQEIGQRDLADLLKSPSSTDVFPSQSIDLESKLIK